jgi:hypothetical protein
MTERGGERIGDSSHAARRESRDCVYLEPLVVGNFRAATVAATVFVKTYRSDRGRLGTVSS